MKYPNAKQAIIDAIKGVNPDCIANGRPGWHWNHDWINCYGSGFEYAIATGNDKLWGDHIKYRITYLMPYQICRHCHRRSNDKD